MNKPKKIRPIVRDEIYNDFYQGYCVHCLALIYGLDARDVENVIRKRGTGK